MRRGAGLDRAPESTVGASLDWLFASWSPEDAAAFDSTLAPFATVDDELWR